MKRFALIASVLVLAACGNDQPPAPRAAPLYAQAAQAAPAAAVPAAAPVIVNNQPAPADSGIKDMLLGGALGYMMGSSSSNRAAAGGVAAATQVIERRVYERAPAPAAQAAAPAQVQPVGPLPKVVPATPPAAKPFAYGAPPAPTPKVTYGAGFSTPKASAPSVTRSSPSFTSRPGAYSRR